MLSCCKLAAAIISCNCPLWVCSFSFNYLQLLTTYFQAFIDNVGIQCILSNLFQRKIKFNELNNFNGWHITSMFTMCESSANNTCFLLLLSLRYINVWLFFPCRFSGNDKTVSCRRHSDREWETLTPTDLTPKKGVKSLQNWQKLHALKRASVLESP